MGLEKERGIKLIEIDKFRVQIEAIKLAVSSLHYREISIIETICNSVSNLIDWYKNTDNIKYIEVAILQIHSYLELGFPYEQCESIFDQAIDLYGYERNTVFPKRFYSSIEIKLNKSQVRSMIRKWNGTKSSSMTIGQVVEDIIDKVKNMKIGTYYYESNLNAGKNEENDIYELVISKNEAFFHDVSRKKYYTFVQ